MKQGTSTMPRRTSTYTSSQARALIENYDVDRRSIFVGSLFEGITKEDVHQLFAPFGKINEVNLREMRSKYNRKCIDILQLQLLRVTLKICRSRNHDIRICRI